MLDSEGSQSVADGVDDRSRRCDSAGFSDAFHPQLVGWGRRDSVVDLEHGELVGGWDEVVGQGAWSHLPPLICVNHFLVYRLDDALSNHTANPACHAQGV